MAKQFEEGSGDLVSLNLQPGIKRDGTVFDGRFAPDGQWTRWRLGRPKKMGGYKEVTNALTGPIRLVATHPISGGVRTFLFSGSGVQYLDVNPNAVGGLIGSPSLTGFVPDPLFTWQADTLFDSSGGGSALIIAHAGRYQNDIADSTNYSFYYQNVLTPAAAWSQSTVQISGGLVILHPYLFVYGNNGLIKNAARNSVTDFTTGDQNEVNVSANKIVRGLPIRGGGNSPAGVFWSLQEVIRVNFVGGATKFTYDAVSAKSSVMSPNGIVEYDGVFYWAGVDRFLLYNGVVKELPNQMNADFFFDNINITQRCKTWATIVPRWGEIWWFFCKGNVSEPNWAIVYNVRENTWYDTPVTRSAGAYNQILKYPLWVDSDPTAIGGSQYQLWAQEFGVDRVTGSGNLAIDSFFDTCDLGFVNGGDPIQGDSSPGLNNWTRIVRVEPDFTQVGDMELQYYTKKYAKSAPTLEVTKTFTSGQEYIDHRIQGRLNRLRFRSNVTGGDFHMGKVLITPEIGDPRSG